MAGSEGRGLANSGPLPPPHVCTTLVIATLWGLFAMADVRVTARLRSLTPGVEIASWRRELAGLGVCREVTRQGGRPAYRP
jgi:hypothetical protein